MAYDNFLSDNLTFHDVGFGRSPHEKPPVEAHDQTYVYSTNSATLGYAQHRDEILQEHGGVNSLAVKHVMAEAGLLIASENHGFAKDYQGREMTGGGSMAIYINNTSEHLGLSDSLVGRVHKLLGGQVSPHSLGFVPSPRKDRAIDLREAREALDLALRDPEFATEAEIVRKRREELFGTKA